MTARHAAEFADTSEHGPIVSVVKMLEVGFVIASLLALLSLAFPSTAPAQDAVVGMLKGAEVMDDRGRSALDGFSQAPVPREQSAALDASDPGGRSIAQERTRAVPPAPASAGHGQDPQEPLPVILPGPANNILAGP